MRENPGDFEKASELIEQLTLGSGNGSGRRGGGGGG